ncbi:hypothetical protein [Burkholderia vietnamiensis]|uniref:hypothetical protein n=1 Tax=Burkholderia vietnamiensis TaxID=60552 RepID=UPI001CB07E95|nr:hypothetical protein [Burkholderia vietnamiensis]CAG9229310.1 hypothetical protein BVI1335_70188 [Burkholderia vietnamiensis]HDR9086287.1 hypothetical protein [Burkholderia vietnamiensis]
MKRIKVIVKGRPGIGCVPVLARIHQLLTAGSLAEVTLGENAKAEIGNLDTSIGMGIAGAQIELELEQENRVPQASKTLVEITEHGLHMVQTLHGVNRTGYNIFTDAKTGQFYFWSWGRQPEGKELSRILGANPEDAADKFLALYESRNGRDKYWKPVRLKTAA